jgi:predicted DsbA family dithiol-disulfide isomerase
MSDRPPRVRLEVFSDYTCPWCYIGLARLEKALARLPETLVVDVEWRPFEIHPGVPIQGMPVEDLPYPPDVWARMQEALRASAGAEELDIGKRPKVSNTHRALLAGVYAQAEEADRFPDFHKRLFTAYFAEGYDLGDPTVVDQLAQDAGVDVDRMRAAIESGRYEATLSATSGDARILGISGTPTFVFDRRFAVSGAQPTEVLIQGFEAALGDPP